MKRYLLLTGPAWPPQALAPQQRGFGLSLSGGGRALRAPDPVTGPLSVCGAVPDEPGCAHRAPGGLRGRAGRALPLSRAPRPVPAGLPWGRAGPQVRGAAFVRPGRHRPAACQRARRPQAPLGGAAGDARRGGPGAEERRLQPVPRAALRADGR